MQCNTRGLRVNLKIQCFPADVHYQPPTLLKTNPSEVVRQRGHAEMKRASSAFAKWKAAAVGAAPSGHVGGGVSTAADGGAASGIKPVAGAQRAPSLTAARFDLHSPYADAIAYKPSFNQFKYLNSEDLKFVAEEQKSFDDAVRRLRDGTGGKDARGGPPPLRRGGAGAKRHSKDRRVTGGPLFLGSHSGPKNLLHHMDFAQTFVGWPLGVHSGLDLLRKLRSQTDWLPVLRQWKLRRPRPAFVNPDNVQENARLASLFVVGSTPGGNIVRLGKLLEQVNERSVGTTSAEEEVDDVGRSRAGTFSTSGSPASPASDEVEGADVGQPLQTDEVDADASSRRNAERSSSPLGGGSTLALQDSGTIRALANSEVLAIGRTWETLSLHLNMLYDRCNFVGSLASRPDVPVKTRNAPGLDSPAPKPGGKNNCLEYLSELMLETTVLLML